MNIPLTLDTLRYVSVALVILVNLVIIYRSIKLDSLRFVQTTLYATITTLVAVVGLSLYLNTVMFSIGILFFFTQEK